MTGAEEFTLPNAAKDIPMWNLPGIEPLGFKGLLVHPITLNEAKESGINKASLELDVIGNLSGQFPKGFGGYQVSVDRLGGRKYYLAAISKWWPEANISVVEEKPNCSAYKGIVDSQQLSVKFMVSGEDHSCLIALASCLAKYVREVHMCLFNNYWRGKYPHLPETTGYYNDGMVWLSLLDQQILATFKRYLIRFGNE